jgi:hypothetical protein
MTAKDGAKCSGAIFDSSIISVAMSQAFFEGQEIWLIAVGWSIKRREVWNWLQGTGNRLQVTGRRGQEIAHGR